MEQIAQKTLFLKDKYIVLLNTLEIDKPAVFGKMNVLQMIEHMAAYIRLAYGKPQITKVSVADEVATKMKQFLLSEKPFKPNTPNSLLPDVPPEPKYKNKEDAIEDITLAIKELFNFFNNSPNAIVLNPFFGYLNFEETIQLLFKHSHHHLAQFNVEI